MPQPTNTVSTYNIRGIAEDFDDKIYNLDPSETPFMSSLSSFKMTQRMHQWQEDTYAVANKDNALIEGDEFSGQARANTFVLANTFQTFASQIVTSNIANEVRKYGRDSQEAYEVRKASIELKKDAEAAFLSNNPSVTGTNSVASKLAGLELFATQAPSHGAGGSTAALTNGVAPAAAPTDGTTRALTEAILTAGLRTMWEAGAKPKVCYLTMGQKNVVNGFAGVATRRTDVPKGEMASVVGSVDVYVYESGPLAFVPIYAERMRTRTLFITDNECCERGFLRPIKKMAMGPTGDNIKHMLVTDLTLKVKNRRGIFKIADLS